MPPASSRPTIASSLTVTAAKPMRSTVAASTPIEDGLLALFDRQAGGGEADDDGIVAGKHKVDGDDLEKGRQARGAETIHRLKAPCFVRRDLVVEYPDALTCMVPARQETLGTTQAGNHRYRLKDL